MIHDGWPRDFSRKKPWFVFVHEEHIEKCINIDFGNVFSTQNEKIWPQESWIIYTSLTMLPKSDQKKRKKWKTYNVKT